MAETIWERAMRRSMLRVLGVVAVTTSVLITLACYPAVDVADRYVAAVFEPDEISFVEGITYGQGVEDTGETIDLKLDVFHPPLDGRARPTLVLMHGGGYLFGARTDFHAEAQQWAQRGYVVVTPSYRLASSVPPDLFLDTGPALDASADAQLANKWIRANAASFDIDADRLAVIGSSAGGVIALLTAQETDLTEGRHDGPESHVATAVFSTGGPARPLLDELWIRTETVAAPALIHHFEQDMVTAYEGDEANFACLVWASEPSTHQCTPTISPGPGHTLGIGPEDQISFAMLMPFLAAELDLANAVDPD